MIAYIIILVISCLISILLGMLFGYRVGFKEALLAHESAVFQFGSTAYVSIENGRKMAIVTLDSDAPLTAEDKLQIVKEVKSLAKKEARDEKKP